MKLPSFKALAVGLWLSVTACSALHAQTRSSGQQEAIQFVQNVLSTKAGGTCATMFSNLSGVSTAYGTFGAGTASTNSAVAYLSNPTVDANGNLHLGVVFAMMSVAPGFVGPSTDTTVQSEDLSILLSQVDPSSITTVQDGFCGTGVKVTGTNGGAIGSAQTRNRKMKGLAPWDKMTSSAQTACTDKESRKKSCTEGQSTLTEQTIYFASNPEMAERFAAAMRQLVSSFGGRPGSF
jgi:hypothetical protein